MVNKNNFIKKLFNKIKENFMSDDFKGELVDPMFVEIKNVILPHYIIFLVLFIIIIVLILYLIILIYNINFYNINK
jgi:hypothetical protein